MSVLNKETQETAGSKNLFMDYGLISEAQINELESLTDPSEIKRLLGEFLNVSFEVTLVFSKRDNKSINLTFF